MVSSGTTPVGIVAGFGDRYGKWDERVQGQHGDYVEGPLEEVMVHDPLPIAEALRKAADLSTRIRGHQTLRDGNHRTALLTFVLTLAESHVLLRPDFSLFRAYIILSARQHPDNRDNVLLDSAITDTTAALFKYSRRRIKPGVPDWHYLDHWSRAIRCLPVYVAHVESSYEHVRKLEEGTRDESLKVQSERWQALTEEERRHISLAHPGFTPGVFKKKGNWMK